MGDPELRAIEFVDRDGVRITEIFHISGNHVPGTAKPGIGIEADDEHALSATIRTFEVGKLDIKARRLLHPRYSQRLVEFSFGYRGSLIDIASTFGHHPEIGSG